MDNPRRRFNPAWDPVAGGLGSIDLAPPRGSGYIRPAVSWRQTLDRARSSAGEHYVDIVGVTGSIPVAPTIFFASSGICERPGDTGSSWHADLGVNGATDWPAGAPIAHLPATAIADRMQRLG